MKDYPVKLSIAVATYNHEHCLANALNSIFEQVHDYTFEVIISDDFSTDNTREIISHFQQKYPEIIKPILQKKNIGVSKNGLQMLRSCRGEYIATLDGDDYWTDPSKLKTQISFLDNNPHIILSCHRLTSYYADTGEVVADSNDAFFKNNPEGFEFGVDSLFEHWLAKTASTVFRNSALDNTPQFEKQRFFSDVTLFWAIVSKGTAYAHNFFGGVYVVHSGGIWSGSNKLKQATMAYQVAEQLLLDKPDNPFLKKFFNSHRADILKFQRQHDRPLDVLRIKKKNFTIISDDGWGAQVYRAFNLQELTPFIGITIYNEDFLALAARLKHHLSQPLRFIDAAASRHNPNYQNTLVKKYPIALLGDTIELHFAAYKSPSYAEQTWKERITRINWGNLLLKMDLSRGENLSDSLTQFQAIAKDYTNSVCFLDALRIRDIEDHPLKNSVHIVEYWNPESEILFPLTHASFDVTGWLNGGTGHFASANRNIPALTTPRRRRLERCWVRYDDHYFVQFDEKNISSLSSYFPKSMKVAFDAEQEIARVYYNKCELEHVRLSAQDKVSWDEVDLFLDLSARENRHVFILAKGIKEHQLRVDLVNEDEHDDIHLTVKGLEQDIPETFQWMHFDLSLADDGQDTNPLFNEIKHLCLYINPNEPAEGSLEMIALYVGSVENFKKAIAD